MRQLINTARIAHYDIEKIGAVRYQIQIKYPLVDIFSFSINNKDSDKDNATIPPSNKGFSSILIFALHSQRKHAGAAGRCRVLMSMVRLRL